TRLVSDWSSDVCSSDLGTPAEEGGGGKVKLIAAGVFKDVDAAMMCHGWDQWILHQDLLGIARVGFEFTGKAAHAAADPWEGLNRSEERRVGEEGRARGG